MFENLQEISTQSSYASEEIPDPSPLVVPGYNLPENIFNKGKPFYLEKDPLTGKVDFETKSSLKLDDDMYEYIDEEPSSDLYDKANIDRKDGSLGSHKPSDVNQLTPNFHDFLNLPVKYNSDKYIYPLISSSYANTKIQGNVNKYQNHKDYNVKTSTLKPTKSPTYYSSSKNSYYPETTSTTTTTTTTTPRSTTEIYLTSKVPDLMNSGMNHPSFHEDFEDYYEPTQKPSDDIYLTTKNVNNIYITTKPPRSTTTKRTISLFEQLFGDYDETVTTTEKTKPPTLFSNLPSNKNNKNRYEGEIKTEKPSFTTTSPTQYQNSHAGHKVLTESHMSQEPPLYEYEEYGDNVAVESKPVEEIRTTTILNNLTSSSDANTKNTTLNSTSVPDYEEITSKGTTTTEANTPKVTSLPLGENHVSALNNHQPIIVATQNLREQLNNERVNALNFDKTVQKPPSTSNIHISPDQDTVSFVVGNHQSVDGGQYVGTSLKGSPYESNPFRPFYGQKDTVSYTIQSFDEIHQSTMGSSVTIVPQRNSEASLSIGVPVNAQKPGQVVDEKLEYPKGTGSKIIFPDDKESNLQPPPPPPVIVATVPPLSNREVLKLNSKPMYHQLPSDLTPPKEKEPNRLERPRPPWDPRPGHFYAGKPEYVRPPRPDIAYKRIDNLPNILPQFRPNMKHHYNRQPLLDRPSNRPIGFFEKLQPPPPPKNLHNLRKIPPPPPQSLEQRTPIAEDRIINEAPKKPNIPQPVQDHFHFFQTPPKVVLPNRRISNLEENVETLQMIQAKKSEKKELPEMEQKSETTTDKPLYVVYPVNTPPIKMDVIDSNNKESVVIGTRAELPLPPSKINNQNFDYDQNPIFNPKDRNDAPILKPHARPPVVPIKSDFPYPLERPDSNPVPETPFNNKLEEGDFFIGENIESRIVSVGKVPNQISATLKTYTEKPIAVAYTPTEPNYDKYSMPNYASPVIPEIRPGSVEDAEIGHGRPDSEFTVSAVMHTHPQLDSPKYENPPINHRNDEIPNVHPEQDFQAPFQASVNIDSLNQGWSVVRDKNKSTSESPEVSTTLTLATTGDFDIENFKPQLEGGFKPIYNFPEDSAKSKETKISEREE